jgi:predicted glycogen debranching enzyme
MKATAIIEQPILNRMPWSRTENCDPVVLLLREWLVTNGLGGYASCSVSGACTRRYHGMLVANFPPPLGRMVMLSHFGEELELSDDTLIDFSGEEVSEDHIDLRVAAFLGEFRLEEGLPIWRYDINGYILEKRLLMPHLQNTVHVSYKLLSGKGPIRLRLRPSMHFRAHEAPVDEPLPRPYQISAIGDRYEISSGDNRIPSLKFCLNGPQTGVVLDGGRFKSVFYRIEQSRGYESRGPLWSPGYIKATLTEGSVFTVIFSTEEWETILALAPNDAAERESERRLKLLSSAHPEVRQGWPAELALAADQFIVTPSRIADAARAHASGDEVRTIFAGYHWFADWGRDTMISLEGLTLSTGRYVEAGYILRTFAHYIRDGLLPNLIPEREQQGRYHTADATLWYFHAIERYVEATGDRKTLRFLLPKLLDIIDHHLKGTRFGIGVDPKDGLLTQGAEGYQLTWMDAKVGDWVVTPRRGKAVEINALWYNALVLMSRWCREEIADEEAARMAHLAARVHESFNHRFWYEEGRYLYDVVDGEKGDDTSLRPNQIFSFSLSHPVLDRTFWNPVLEVVERRLLTPYGLRSLDPDHPDYKRQYYGDLRARDAAYHQGTVWAWLIGPFVDAWIRVHPEQKHDARKFLRGFANNIGDGCIGSINEIFDAEDPFIPRGCVAQAWSVAEVLRCWIETARR